MNHPTKKTGQITLFLALLLGLLIFGSGCGLAGSDTGRVKLKHLPLASLEEMPDYVHDSPERVQEAYRFAVANPEALEHIPCYCGCNSLGHINNYECYAKTSDQVTEFDNHAAFCGVCVDITLDVMQLTREGKPLADIRAFIDNKYSQYGPTTDTPPVVESLSQAVGPEQPHQDTDSDASQ